MSRCYEAGGADSKEGRDAGAALANQRKSLGLRFDPTNVYNRGSVPFLHKGRRPWNYLKGSFGVGSVLRLVNRSLRDYESKAI